ncbi:MAG: EAL domain-containing protein [Burkholderiales bacterium]|nr:EAL domain-containing protein [Burkholderiales bacterium]
MASPIPDGSRQASPAPARHGLVVPYAWLGTVLLAQTALATFLLRETEWGVASLVSLGLSAIASGLVLLRVFEARIGRVQRKLESILSELEHARPTIGSHSRDAGVLELIDSIAAHTSTLISMTVEREKQILKAALQDPVTGLGNRTVLSHRIDIAIKAQAESGARFCIAIVEIGRFKEIAEMLGTGQMNDGVNQIARRLRRELRKDDTIVRLGDERFALLVRGDRDVAEPVLNRIAESGRQPLMIGGELVDIKVHIGAAMYPDDANSETNLLLHAQLAAERSSRNRTASGFFEAKQDNKLTVQRNDSRELMSLQSDLNRAIADRQLFLVYQPKLDLKTGLFTGIEALIRWQHPKKGLVSPDQFIPMAEENGLMQSITEWVLTEGAGFAKALCSRRPEMCVSVNISAQDIERRGFSAFANQAIRDQGILPGQLCLEVTESGLFEDTANVIATLSELSNAGLRLSIDDFGTGYSTLKQLQHLPVSEMKIDRSFVSGLASNTKNQAILKSMIDMGARMGMRVVAEGVESFREMQALQKLGCHEVQGFFISRPLPAQEVLSFIDMRHALYDSSREDALKLASQH